MNKSGEENNLSLPERHGRILALLQQYGSISVTQLSERFRVSEVTIRKDLSFLEQQKKLYRTHGSAILISPYISDRHVNEKEKKNVAEKQALGAAAAALLAQDAQDGRVRQRPHREPGPEPGAPRKGTAQPGRAGAELRLIIDIAGRRKRAEQLLRRKDGVLRIAPLRRGHCADKAGSGP